MSLMPGSMDKNRETTNVFRAKGSGFRIQRLVRMGKRVIKVVMGEYVELL